MRREMRNVGVRETDNFVGLLIAGHDTTASSLGIALFHLAAAPDALAALHCQFMVRCTASLWCVPGSGVSSARRNAATERTAGAPAARGSQCTAEAQSRNCSSARRGGIAPALLRGHARLHPAAELEGARASGW